MQILIVGDTHQDAIYWMELKKELKKDRYPKPDVIVQLGDFGFEMGNYSYIQIVSDVVSEIGCDLYFIDGNHENFDALEGGYYHMEGDFRRITHNIIHIPRGTTFTWDGVKFMGFGGSYSVDQLARVADEMAGYGKGWWVQEFITDEQVELARSKGQVDVMFTHDVPEGVDGLQEAFITKKGRFLSPIDLCTQQRKQVAEVFYSAKPKRLYHGHYHIRYTGKLHGCIIEGLNCNGGRITDSFTFLDTNELRT